VPPARSHRTALAAAALVVVLLAGAVLLTPGVWRTSGTDVSLYHDYGARIRNGAVPYRDFFVEYPPGSLVPMALPAVATTSPRGFGHLFVGEMLVLLAVTSLVVAATASGAGMGLGRSVVAMLPVAIAPLLLGPVVVQRFDVLAALLSVLAVAACVRGRWSSAGVAVAAGTAVKLYPVLILPAVVAYAAARGGRRSATRVVAAFAVVTAGAFAPFVVLSPRGLWHALDYQLARPLQVETLVSGAALVAHLLAGFAVGLHTGSGSVNYAWPAGAAAHLAQRAVFVIALLVTVGFSLLKARGAVGFILAAATVTAVAVTFGSVLSPQYVVWLLPLVPLVAGNAGVALTGALVAVMVATRIEYAKYTALVRHLSSDSILWLAIRNALLLALCLTLCARLFAARQSGDASP